MRIVASFHSSPPTAIPARSPSRARNRHHPVLDGDDSRKRSRRGSHVSARRERRARPGNVERDDPIRAFAEDQPRAQTPRSRSPRRAETRSTRTLSSAYHDLGAQHRRAPERVAASPPRAARRGFRRRAVATPGRVIAGAPTAPVAALDTARRGRTPSGCCKHRSMCAQIQHRELHRRVVEPLDHVEVQ